MKLLLVITLLVAAVAASAIPERDTRVVGGAIAALGQFPYSVGLLTRINVIFGSMCSGSLVSTRFILTSANCVNGIQSAVAVMGGLRIHDSTEPGQYRVTVTQFIIHRGFEEDSDSYDVALVELPFPVTESERIRPVRLPNRRQIQASFNGQQGTFMGWGRFGEGNSLSDVLRFGRSQVISNLACRVSLPTSQILDAHICTAGFSQNPIQGSPCPGDSGSPLTIVDADGITTQIGVFSYNSVLGCDSGRAAVFTRMSAYLDWIGENSDVVIRDDF
ncbi:collagenase-like [Toxorhynchites rutilus septentrionalis]|uniref:collagenase-like n=1 Tax=Toxorhynchites rutilus septentrionalis TaxID=329112 RepID=UPI002479010B|nr:collagenase-like [Toxorhynchites rutilus septentrionalis]